jgi:uncharacterized membrane protein
MREIFSTKRSRIMKTWLYGALIALLVPALWLAITSNGNAVVRQALSVDNSDDELLAWHKSAFRW